MQDIISIAGELSKLSEEVKNKELYDISMSISDLTTESVREGNNNGEILYELNAKINEFIQTFTKIANENGLQTKIIMKTLIKFQQIINLQTKKK